MARETPPASSAPSPWTASTPPERTYRRVYLWTFDGLTTARRLYESRGLHLVEDILGETWGRPLREQRLEWTAAP
jgi:hypothetical protein